MSVSKKLWGNLPCYLQILAAAVILLNYAISEKNLIFIEASVGILFFISYLIEIYRDISVRQYSTTLYIIGSDLIKIAALILLCYYNFMNYDRTDLLFQVKRHNIMSVCGFLIIFMIPVKSFLQVKRFKNSNN